MKKLLQKFYFGENTKMALTTLRQHKLRSFLTVLGVVIGVTSLIAVASIMVGLDEDMHGFLEQFGADTLFVFKFSPGIHVGRLSDEERNRKPLTYDDAMAVLAEAPAVKAVAPEAYPRIGQGPMPQRTARYKGKEIFNVDYSGELPSYEDVFNIQMKEGRFFSDAESEHREDICVIGYDIAETFFPGGGALGKQILVADVTYTIIGVEDKKKGNFFKDQSSDREIKVPFFTYRKHHPNDDEVFLGVQPYPGMKAAATDEVREILRRRRHVAFNKPDNFGISSAEEISDQFRQMMSMVALITIVISSIGLLVGGVGVMNIMLMSVTERTREIGVRKAIGARKSDIIRQFLTEAITLTGMGGVIGVLLGFLISEVINLALPALPSAVPLWAVVTGVLMAMSVGLFFGIYPAMRAARLDPVDALRYE